MRKIKGLKEYYLIIKNYYYLKYLIKIFLWLNFIMNFKEYIKSQKNAQISKHGQRCDKDESCCTKAKISKSLDL